MSKSRTKNSARNAFFGISNQFIMLILNFISRTIFIKILGEDYLGVNGLYSNILTILSLAELGVGQAMVYSFYMPLKDKDKNKLSALTTFYKKLYNYIAIAVAILGIVFIPFLDLICDSKLQQDKLVLYYVLFLLNTITSYLFVYKTSIINADQKKYLVTINNFKYNVIKVILQTIFLLITHNFVVYLLINPIATFLSNFELSRKAEKMYPYINEKRELSKEEKKSIFQNIKAMFIYKISTILLNGTDNILISALVGTVYVGFYANYSMLINSVSAFITALFQSVHASIGNLIVDGSIKRRYEVYKILNLIGIWISCICTTCFFILFNDFIYMWLGEKYVFNNFIVFSIVLNFYLFVILNPIWSFREATGMFKKTKYVMVCTAVINLVLSIILGKFFGIFGILISSAIARVCTYFWYEPLILFKEYFNVSPIKYFKKQLLSIILVTLSIVATCLSTSFISKPSIVGIFIKLIICLLISNIICIIIFHKSEEFMYLKELFTSKVLRKYNRKKGKNIKTIDF